MNIMPIEKRVQIIQLLVEGNSMRSIEGIVRCSINTVTKVLCDVGAACTEYHDKNVRDLQSKLVECDAIWSFCCTKQKSVKAAKAPPEGACDVWTWTAIDTDSRLVVSYLLGGRDAEYAVEFIGDLRSRINTKVQLTTDGHKAYLNAVEDSFGGDVDYAQLVKMYGNTPDGGKVKYSPAGCSPIKKIPISGKPVKNLASTSGMKYQNLTMRMYLRRVTNVTNGLGKKLENRLHAVSLHFMYYNFVKVHKALRVTPAMEAGISDHVWSIEEIARLVPDAMPKKRGSYKTKKDISHGDTIQFRNILRNV